MRAGATYSTIFIALATFIFFSSVTAVPVESDDEQSENSLMTRMEGPENSDMSAAWDPITAATLRKLLLQLDTDDRLGRVGRSWPQSEPRGWGLRAVDGRLARQWRADKRQVRFRQCYFNPISCFRK